MRSVPREDEGEVLGDDDAGAGVGDDVGLGQDALLEPLRCGLLRVAVLLVAVLVLLVGRDVKTDLREEVVLEGSSGVVEVKFNCNVVLVRQGGLDGDCEENRKM